MLAWSESWADEPLPHLPDQGWSLPALEAALEAVRLERVPAHPGEIIAALERLARRHGLDMPDPEDLELDMETYLEWPAPAFRLAFKVLWGRWRTGYRRFPAPGDFHEHAAGEIAEIERRYHKLDAMVRKLGTKEMLDQLSNQR